MQGQTILEASGDSGSDGARIPPPKARRVPLLSQSPEAAQPYVMSVGGTTITQAGNPPAEQVWNDGIYSGAGGGGISSLWAAPSWQANSRVPGLLDPSTVKAAESATATTFCGTGSCRELPDVSAQADEFTGAVTVYLGRAGSRSAGPPHRHRCGPRCSRTSTRRRPAGPAAGSASCRRGYTRLHRTRASTRRRSTTSSLATMTCTPTLRAYSRRPPATTWPPASGRRR